MKKSVLLTLALGCSTLGFAQAQLSGKIAGLTSEKLVIRLINTQNNAYERTDTVSAPGGQFTYTCPDLTGYRTAVIRTVPVGEEKAVSFSSFVCPGQSAVVSGSVSELQFNGTSLYAASNKAEELMKPYMDKQQAIVAEYNAAKDAGSAAEKLDEIEGRYEAEGQEMAKAALEYVKAHPAEETSFFLVENCEDRLQAYGLLAANLRGGAMKDYIQGMEASLKAAAEREAKMKEAQKFLQPGMPAPEITLNDLEGKPFSLSQLKGKYVILDWWGSWCIWCIRGIPKMKEYYAKYSSKMEILGIDCRDSETAWKNAVKKHELPWKHVYMPKDSKLTETYAIEGYPTKCIINPDGTINKIIVGEDPKFYDYLDELLKD